MEDFEGAVEVETLAGPMVQGVDLSRDHIAAGPIHTGDEVSRASFADDGIAFPIAESRSFVGLFRAFIDGSFARDLTLAQGLAIGLAAGFSRDPQEGTELRQLRRMRAERLILLLLLTGRLVSVLDEAAGAIGLPHRPARGA